MENPSHYTIDYENVQVLYLNSKKGLDIKSFWQFIHFNVSKWIQSMGKAKSTSRIDATEAILIS